MTDDRKQKVLSCASCRQRKIKCDKVVPVCTQCSRASIECVYPSRKPTRRAPRPRQSELLERISRLENIVGKANPSKLQELDRELSASRSPPEAQNTPSHDGQRQASVASGTPASTRGTPKEDTTARYISNEFWNNLCGEVEGIKHALDQPSDEEDDAEEEDDGSPESHPSPQVLLDHPSGCLMGNPSYHERDKPSHPPRDLLVRLWALYLRNVDPLMKFLHRPTVTEEIYRFANSGSYILSPSKHALLFCIYFGAVTSLTESECIKQLGLTKEVAAPQYRMNAERALAAADYLANPDLTALQAVTIYVTMLRNYHLSRTTWVLTSMVIRLAQTMNLHNDGDGHRFSPFEAEMRRRLWFYLTVLDIRGAEDRGSDSILTGSSYNTIIPTNIDDDSFGPESVELIPKPTPAENVFSMCTARCTTFGHITHPHGTSETSLLTEDHLISHVRALENDFIHTVDPSNVASVYASEVARIVILKLWLIVQYPFDKPIIPPLRVSRETMLRTAVSVMELYETMQQGVWTERFAWWTRCYAQWHPLAVALAELCVQTEGELADQAWKLIDRVFPHWKENVADSSKGALWRPIRKLYRKAKEARAASLMKNMDLNGLNPQPPPPLTQVSGMAPELLAEPCRFDPASQTVASAGPTRTPAAVPSFPVSFDATADPSSLFEYLLQSGEMNFDPGLGNNMGFDMGAWNEFLDDSRMDDSPESGTGESNMSM